MTAICSKMLSVIIKDGYLNLFYLQNTLGVCTFLSVFTTTSVTFCVCVLIAQSCPTICDPMNYSPPGLSAMPGILEEVTIPFSSGSSQPRGRILVSCIGKRILHHLSHHKCPATVFNQANMLLLLTLSTFWDWPDILLKEKSAPLFAFLEHSIDSPLLVNQAYQVLQFLGLAIYPSTLILNTVLQKYRFSSCFCMTNPSGQQTSDVFSSKFVLFLILSFYPFFYYF